MAFHRVAVVTSSDTRVSKFACHHSTLGGLDLMPNLDANIRVNHRQVALQFTSDPATDQHRQYAWHRVRSLKGKQETDLEMEIEDAEDDTTLAA